jgi:hypothetical protein
MCFIAGANLGDSNRKRTHLLFVSLYEIKRLCALNYVSPIKEKLVNEIYVHLCKYVW